MTDYLVQVRGVLVSVINETHALPLGSSHRPIQERAEAAIMALLDAARAQGPGPGEAVADDEAQYQHRLRSDFATALTRDLSDDFPNYADWSVTLPAGHWRDLLKMLAATPTREA